MDPDPRVNVDSNTPVQELRDMVRRFVDERRWQRYHAPKNISMALAIEAAELMEHFQWIEVESSRFVHHNDQTREAVAEELADVLCYALALANELQIDVATAMKHKMVKNRQKYPAPE